MGGIPTAAHLLARVATRGTCPLLDVKRRLAAARANCVGFIVTSTGTSNTLGLIVHRYVYLCFMCTLSLPTSPHMPLTRLQPRPNPTAKHPHHGITDVQVGESLGNLRLETGYTASVQTSTTHPQGPPVAFIAASVECQRFLERDRLKLPSFGSDGPNGQWSLGTRSEGPKVRAQSKLPLFQI
eukprot:1371633-Amorphochlora_amoeboformis.AAC.1